MKARNLGISDKMRNRRRRTGRNNWNKMKIFAPIKESMEKRQFQTNVEINIQV